MRVYRLILFWLLVGPAYSAEMSQGWEARSVREEVRPEFSFSAEGGPDGAGGLAISCKGEEQTGCWEKSFPVAGGQWYRFSWFYWGDARKNA